MMVRRAEGKDSRDSHLGLELTGLRGAKERADPAMTWASGWQ